MADQTKKYLTQENLLKLVQGLKTKFDAAYDAKYLAKGQTSASDVKYSNTSMSGVADVKSAIDVLVENVVRQEVGFNKNMEAVEAKADAAQAAAEAAQGDVDALELVVGKAAEGEVAASGLFKAIADGDKALDDKIAAEEQARKSADDALDGRLDILEGMVGLGGEGDKTVSERLTTLEAAVEAAATKTELAAEKEALQGEIDSDIAAESALRVAEEQRIEGLANAAQADADALEKRLDDEGGLVDRLEAVEQFVEGHDDTERDQKIAALEAKFTGENSVDAKITAAQSAAEAKAAELDSALETSLQGKIDAKVAQSAYDTKVAEIEGDIDDLESFVSGHSHEAIEKDIDALEAKMVGLKKDTVQAAIDDAEAAAKTDAAAALKAAQDAQADIDAFMDANAVKEGAVDTLKEIQDYIDTHGQAADQMVQNIAKAQKAADDEAARAKAAEEQLAKDYAAADAQVLADAKQDAADKVAAEVTRVDAKIAADVKAEADRAKGVEAGFETRIAANEAFVAAQPAIDKAQSDRISVLEGLVVGGEGEGLSKVISDVAANASAIEKLNGTGEGSVAKAVADAVATEKGRAELAEQGLDGRIDTLETAVAEGGSVAKGIADAKDAAKAAQDDVDALELLVGTIGETASDKTVCGKISSIEAEIATLASSSDLENAEDRIDALEEFQAGHSHASFATKDELAGEKSRAEGIEAGLATRISDLEKIDHEAYKAADADLHTTISAEIDADVKVVADELAKQKDAVQEGTLANKIAANASEISALKEITALSEQEIDAVLTQVFGA